MVATGAVLPEKYLVVGAGERYGQVPDLLPGAAVLLLDGAAVAGQAVRAVAERVVEQPAVDRRWPRPVLGAGDGRVAICPRDEREVGGLVWASRVAWANPATSRSSRSL